MRALVPLLLLLLPSLLTAQNLFGSLFERTTPTADERLLGETPVPLGAGEAPEGAVLFVHGYDSDSAGWRDLAERLRRKGFARLHGLDLPDKGKDDTIEAHARTLARRIREISNGPDDRVHLVAHSMGGLVCRRYLADREAARLEGPSRRAAEFRNDPCIPLLVTMGTPHHGTSFFTADLLGSFRSRPLVVARTQMATDSDFVTALNAAPVSEETQVHSLWVERDGVILPPASSVLQGAANHQLPDWCEEGQGWGHLGMRRHPSMMAAVERLLLGEALPVTGPQSDDEALAHTRAWQARRDELRRLREAEAAGASGNSADGEEDPLCDGFDELAGPSD